MLVLSRKVGERLIIGDDVVLVVSKISGNRVTFAIDAPAEVRVVRGELAPLPPEPEAAVRPGRNERPAATSPMPSTIRERQQGQYLRPMESPVG